MQFRIATENSGEFLVEKVIDSLQTEVTYVSFSIPTLPLSLPYTFPEQLEFKDKKKVWVRSFYAKEDFFYGDDAYSSLVVSCKAIFKDINNTEIYSEYVGINKDVGTAETTIYAVVAFDNRYSEMSFFIENKLGLPFCNLQIVSMTGEVFPSEIKAFYL